MKEKLSEARLEEEKHGLDDSRLGHELNDQCFTASSTGTNA